MEKLIEFNNAARLRETLSDYSQIDNSYIFCHIQPGDNILAQLIDNEPMKFSGTMLVLVRTGSEALVEVNLERQTVLPGTLLTIFPGNVVRAIGELPSDVDAYLLYLDTTFSRSVNINLSSIAIPASVQRPRPSIKLTPEEAELLSKYLLLIYDSSLEESSVQLKKSIASSLIAAMFYQLVLFYHKRLPAEINSDPSLRAANRRNDYVREFVRLVHLHYNRERSVAFYADRLFISPKYLSLLVKQATGRSAAKWIDDFVLMEAKNLLRFSGKNIQQIAYALNFSTQSSFGKYFKHLTGMSPSEYQKEI